MHDAYALSDLMLSDHFVDSISPSKTIEDGRPAEVTRGIKGGKVIGLDGWVKID